MEVASVLESCLNYGAYVVLLTKCVGVKCVLRAKPKSDVLSGQ